MPTHEEWAQFLREYHDLTPQQQTLFIAAMKKMVADLRAGKEFRPSLRIKGVQGHPGVFEMTWDMPDGRATFAYGSGRTPGDPHIIWRRVGGHEIFREP